jgi:hypothetical protein
MTRLEHDKFRLTSAKWVSLRDSLRLSRQTFANADSMSIWTIILIILVLILLGGIGGIGGSPFYGTGYYGGGGLGLVIVILLILVLMGRL